MKDILNLIYRDDEKKYYDYLPAAKESPVPILSTIFVILYFFDL